MKKSKKDVLDSVLFFADLYKKKASYEAIIDIQKEGITRIIEMIVYDMFINKFNSYHCSDDEYDHYKNIIEYASELRKNGFVEYNN